MSLTLPSDLIRWAPPPRRFRYARVGTAGQFPLPRLIVEEEWGDPVARDGRTVFRRISRVDDDNPRVIEDALIGYGEDGLTDLGTWNRDDVLTLWSPPQVVLPLAPEAGATWEATHIQGERESHRSVELMACTTHRSCLVVVSTSQQAKGMFVMTSHYVDGEGFCGFEALTKTPGRPSIRVWSEAVTVTRRT